LIDPALKRPSVEQNRAVWLRAWLIFGRRMGEAVSWILLTAFYFLIILPYGLIFKLTKADPLRWNSEGSGWQTTPSQYDSLQEAQEQ